jgi:phosphate transport system substrate-binding protein
MTYGLLQNKAGAYVPPDRTSFLAAAEGTDWSAVPDFHVLLTDSARPDADPMMATSFVLIRKYGKQSGVYLDSSAGRWRQGKIRRHR